jgi:hypothetical protein
MTDPPDREELLRQANRLDALARVLDDWVRVPGTGIRFGVDSVLGLIPVVGDAATGALSAYLVVRAWEIGLPTGVIARMLGNVGVDLLVGSVPVAGDLFDVGFKANRRNVDLLKRELARRLDDPPAQLRG